MRDAHTKHFPTRADFPVEVYMTEAQRYRLVREEGWMGGRQTLGIAVGSGKSNMGVTLPQCHESKGYHESS
jgi:hypothetical protein